MATANYLLQSPYTPSKTITDHLLALMRPYCPACPTFPYAAPNSQHCLCPCSPLTSSLYCMCMSASAQLRHSSLPTLLIHHQPSSFWRVNSPSQSRTRSKSSSMCTSRHPTPPATAFLHPEDMHAEPLSAVGGPVAPQALERCVETRAKTGPGPLCAKRIRRWGGVTCSRGMIYGSSTRTRPSSGELPQGLTRALRLIQCFEYR